MSRVQWNGLTEYLKEFGSIPAHLHEQGMAIIREETEGAAVEIAQTYVRGKTGNLKSRVRTSYPATTLLVGLVRSASPHSHLYEFGTKKRQNAGGANRGVMPETPVTVPIARRRRARMARRMVDLLRRAGFNVGNAG